MKISTSLLFFLLWICLFELSRLESIVDITRNTDGDIFSNPVSKCDVCEETSCEVHDNLETGGKCVSLENCCKECVCPGDRTTYLRREKRCISNENLTATLFRDLHQGCSYRLVSSSYYDNRPRGRQPCIFSNLRLHALNTSVSGSQKIDVCGIFSWSISSCSVLSGAHYKNGHWTDLWGVGSVKQDIFSVEKRDGVDIFLKWNDTLPSRFHGDILSLDIKCYRKFNRSPMESCLLFKVKGTQMDTRPSTTTPPTNVTGIPTNIESRGKPKSSDKTMIIIISVICAFIFLVLFCVVILCARKRGRMCTKKKYKREMRVKMLELRQTAGKHVTISSPTTKNQAKKYQCANQAESPVYTTPAKTSNKTDMTVEYQNLLQAIASTPHYHPLFVKDDKQTPRPSSPPYYHEPEKPGNKPVKNDSLPHFYHVLEGP